MEVRGGGGLARWGRGVGDTEPQDGVDGKPALRIGSTECLHQTIQRSFCSDGIKMKGANKTKEIQKNTK